MRGVRGCFLAEEEYLSWILKDEEDSGGRGSWCAEVGQRDGRCWFYGRQVDVKSDGVKIEI